MHIFGQKGIQDMMKHDNELTRWWANTAAAVVLAIFGYDIRDVGMKLVCHHMITQNGLPYRSSAIAYAVKVQLPYKQGRHFQIEPKQGCRKLCS